VPGTVYVIGAGLSGLSAATYLVKSGARVHLIEGANYAGGRCRSYYDQTLEQRIDNGNHLVLSGNKSVREFLEIIGSAETMWSPERAEFPFLDLVSGERWVVKPDAGKIPWSLLSKSGRVPGSTVSEYLRGLKLAMAGHEKTAGECLNGDGVLYHRFWEPLAVSVLNTDPAEASAKLLWPVLKETFGKGEGACRPLIAKVGLSESFVDPAINYLKNKDCTVSLGARLRNVTVKSGKVERIEYADSTVQLKQDDKIVLAVPPNAVTSVLPEVTVPDEYRAIVNAHFRLPVKLAGPVSFIGLTGGVGHWLFVRGNIASVTISAAEKYVNLPSEHLAEVLWAEIRKALRVEFAPLGLYRIVKEKRATFAQTPEQIKKRPKSTSTFSNVYFAGDWTATGLPATIEGSLLSGKNAAKAVLRDL
jgi:squalene-associated FAD-dependent desaturase